VDKILRFYLLSWFLKKPRFKISVSEITLNPLIPNFFENETAQTFLI